MKWITGIIASMGAIIALLLNSRKNQKARADEAVQKQKELDEVLERVEKSIEAKRVVNADPNPVERLREDWTRD